MIAIDATMDEQPRVLAYHWVHDAETTRDDIAWHAGVAIDCYGLAGPIVWFVDDKPTLIFHDRPHAARLLAEIRPQDHILLSMTSVPIVAEWVVTACRLLRLSENIHSIDSDTTNMIDIDHDLVHAYEEHILNICRGVDEDSFRKTTIAVRLE